MQNVNENALAYRGGASGVKYLGRGPRIDWGVILVLPGDALSGHYHEQVEETFYIIQGKGTFTIDDVVHQVVEGDVYRLEATERHSIHNDSDQPLKLVFIKCPYLPDDKVDC